LKGLHVEIANLQVQTKKGTPNDNYKRD